MGFKKYKYYFRKPKSEIARDIISGLAIAGMILVAANSPYFVNNLIKSFKKTKKYPRKKIYDTFYSLKRQGCVKIEKKNNQIYVSLTENGKKKANWLQINNLKIRRFKKWDKKWRLVLFDIAQLKKIYREAFRGKLKELGFYPLQKSIWVHPFDCEAEVELLRDFFGLSGEEVRLVVSENIGDDGKLRKIFHIK